MQNDQQIRVIHKMDIRLRYNNWGLRFMKLLNYLNPNSLFKCCKKPANEHKNPASDYYFPNDYKSCHLSPMLTEFIHGLAEQKTVPIMNREDVPPELQCHLDRLWIRYENLISARNKIHSIFEKFSY